MEQGLIRQKTDDDAYLQFRSLADDENTKLLDLENACTVINRDAKKKATRATFGKNAWRFFIQDTAVLAALDNRRVDIGRIAPVIRGGGGTFMGRIIVGDCELELWTYDGTYDDPQTGDSTPYLHPDKVVVQAANGRLDMVHGGIPRVIPPDPRLEFLIPGRLSDMETGLDIMPNVASDKWGNNIEIGAAARPLAVPTDIDSFACIDTTVAP